MTDEIALASTIAYPGSGKTTIARYLSKELDFHRIASDDMRLMVHNEQFGDQTYTAEKEGFLWQIDMPMLRNVRLLNGYNTVIETCGNNPEGRAAMLGMEESFAPIPEWVKGSLEERDHELHRYQIKIDVDEDILIQRMMERDGRTEENARGMLHLKRFGEVPIDGVETLVYENNTLEDLEFMKTDLTEKFEPYQKAYQERVKARMAEQEASN